MAPACFISYAFEVGDDEMLTWHTSPHLPHVHRHASHTASHSTHWNTAHSRHSTHHAVHATSASHVATTHATHHITSVVEATSEATTHVAAKSTCRSIKAATTHVTHCRAREVVSLKVVHIVVHATSWSEVALAAEISSEVVVSSIIIITAS